MRGGAVRISVSSVTTNSLFLSSTDLIISLDRKLKSSVLFCRHEENYAIVQELQLRYPHGDEHLCHAFLGSCSLDFQADNVPRQGQVGLQIYTGREQSLLPHLLYTVSN